MVEEYSDKEVEASGRTYLAVFVLATTAFAYYYVTLGVLTEIISTSVVAYLDKLLVLGAFYVGVGISTAIGAVLSIRLIERNRLFLSWLAFGILASLLSSLIGRTTIDTLSGISFLLGISVGLGMPSSVAYFADATPIGRRGRIGGFLGFTFNICLFGLSLCLVTLTPLGKIQAFTFWLGISLVIFLLVRQQPTQFEKSRNPELLAILRERRVLLYLAPWIMFCLVNASEAPILSNFFGSEFYSFSLVAELAISSVSTIAAGILADWVGRKPTAIIGFVLLGIGYAVLGMFPDFVFSGVMVSWYLYVVVDGVAWGIFVVLFFITLWGDLGGNRIKEKYYFVGGLPFLLAWFVQLVIEPYINSISIYAAFSLASFFLFLAVVPLMYAPETLPEKKIKERELKKYIEKAKKVRAKYE